jgi:hypothetical protein
VDESRIKRKALFMRRSFSNERLFVELFLGLSE